MANRAGHNASVLDKKISIFEKALAANPHRHASCPSFAHIFLLFCPFFASF
jgi:hypothetical protein